MALTAHNHIPVPSFMYGTAWKKNATRQLVELAVTSGFRAIDTANQLIHYNEALVGEALQALAHNPGFWCRFRSRRRSILSQGRHEVK